MTAPAAERMSRVDTAWLRMDNDVNLMMIVGVWLLTPAITLAALRERIADKLLKYDRFRQKRGGTTPMGASWVEDEDFDIERTCGARLLREAPARPRRGAAASAVRRAGHQPLDPRHPLWQFHLIEDYEGGSALVAASTTASATASR
jgi:diacylglycerol O-acyltransferase